VETVEEEEDYAGDQFAQMECGAQELKERLEAGEDVVVVDVREHHEVKSGILPDAVHIPMGQLPARWEELAEANEIVCYCAAGIRSYDTAAFLRTKGLFNATSLEGGISAWRAIGGETPKPS
jgi:rhodanese-related sulfurtransferase